MDSRYESNVAVTEQIGVARLSRSHNMLRTRGLMFRIRLRSNSVVGVTSRTTAPSLNEQDRLPVVQVNENTQVLPPVVHIDAYETRPKLSDASTQTSTSGEADCDPQHELACCYIDRMLSTETTQGDYIPVDLLCPITHHAIRIPVVAEDGYTYEQTAIKQWLLRSNVSPVTRQSLQDTHLYYNRSFANLTQSWARSHYGQELYSKINSTLIRV